MLASYKMKWNSLFSPVPFVGVEVARGAFKPLAIPSAASAASATSRRRVDYNDNNNIVQFVML